ncbi:MAG TPA: MBL fold metallo-hydrolase [Solirubrobacteraceae bacterium]|nr:MBL fold metallo-hydrolase [Solirubrobacteraceae bacterium]
MRTTPITDNLIQLTRLGLVNAYLVREDDGFTLIDTMLPRSGRDIIAAADRAGGPIRRVIFTHGHGDHVGSLDELAAALPDAEIAMGHADVEIHTGQRPKTSGNWPKLKTPIAIELTGGERIGSLEVVPSPGHTPGHVSFLDTRDRSLISGDVFSSIGGLAVSSKLHWRFPLVYMGTGDRPTDLESARAMRALDPTRLALGHGGVLVSPTPMMDAAIAAAS